MIALSLIAAMQFRRNSCRVCARQLDLSSSARYYIPSRCGYWIICAMAFGAFLGDLLPPLFDSAVGQLTRRKLLPVERDAILAALVNSVGEAVLRRVRDAANARTLPAGSLPRDLVAPESKPKEIRKITTSDRFSDQWMARTEIVESIEHSSGLDGALSELALSLIEFRLDSALAAGEFSIVGLGIIKPAPDFKQQPPKLQPTFDRIKELLLDASSEPRRRRFGTLLEFVRTQPPRPARRLLEIAQIFTDFREPFPYTIELSDGLAFKSDDRVAKIMEVSPSEENRFRFKGSADTSGITGTSSTT